MAANKDLLNVALKKIQLLSQINLVVDLKIWHLLSK
jgi:hypothetical protein